MSLSLIPESLTTQHLQSSLYPVSGPDYCYWSPCLECIKNIILPQGIQCLGVCLGNCFYSCKKHTFTKKCTYNNPNINLLGEKVPEPEGSRWLREIASSGHSRTGTHINSYWLWRGARASSRHTSLRAERRAGLASYPVYGTTDGSVGDEGPFSLKVYSLLSYPSSSGRPYIQEYLDSTS